MAEFKAYIKNDELNFDGPEDKVEYFTQFIEEMEEATDITTCECKSNEKVREVIGNYFPDFVDEIMEVFEDNSGYCDCEIGVNLMSKNSIIKKLGRYMDSQDI